MPELPEVETIRLALQKDLIGKTIDTIEILEKKQFTGNPDKIFNKEITAISRHGKILSLVLEDGLYLTIHLKLTGQLLFVKNNNNPVFTREIARTGTNRLPAKTTRIIIHFTDNSALYFNDLRKFGWIRLLDRQDTPISIDVLSDSFTLQHFKKAIMASAKAIKNLLLEQDKFAGIGNIYANDALWQARIHPLRKGKSLNDVEIGELFLTVNKIIAEGLQYDGTSDDFYVLPNALKGKYQNHMKVYHREGLPCFRCGTAIKRIKHNGRSSFYCPHCQKNS